MRKLLLPLTAAALLASPAGVGAAGKTVRVDDDFFSPKTMTVSKGTTVTWKWVGSSPHNVVSSGAARFSSKIQRTGTYKRTLRKAGTYRIVCTIHAGMKQTIKVR